MRRATKLIPGIVDLSYSDRLQHIELSNVACRRVRGDMIVMFKILTGIYDLASLHAKRLYIIISPLTTDHITREYLWSALRRHGHRILLCIHSAHCSVAIHHLWLHFKTLRGATSYTFLYMSYCLVHKRGTIDVNYYLRCEVIYATITTVDR
jgi:hypothetical protein